MKAGSLSVGFKKLQTWSANGRRAPHKPLLVLWGIGRLLTGQERLVSFREDDRELAKLLRSFGPHRRTLHTEDPFWRLQNDGVWEIRDASRVTVGLGGNAHRSSLLQQDIHGGFPRAIHAALQANEEISERITRELVESHFPETLHDEVQRAPGIDSDFVQSRRLRRDSRFREAVLAAYGHLCAVCDFAVRLNDSPIALEAAHIKWHRARGPDQIRNGIALCALHHRLFDKGAFTLSPYRNVVVAKSASGQGFDESLGRFDSKPISLPARDVDAPDPRFSKWHAREVFSTPYGSARQ